MTTIYGIPTAPPLPANVATKTYVDEKTEVVEEKADSLEVVRSVITTSGTERLSIRDSSDNILFNFGEFFGGMNVSAKPLTCLEPIYGGLTANTDLRLHSTTDPLKGKIVLIDDTEVTADLTISGELKCDGLTPPNGVFTVTNDAAVTGTMTIGDGYVEPYFSDAYMSPEITKTGRNFVAISTASRRWAIDPTVINCGVTTTNYRILTRINEGSQAGFFGVILNSSLNTSGAIGSPAAAVYFSPGSTAVGVTQFSGGLVETNLLNTQSIGLNTYVEWRLENKCQEYSFLYHGPTFVSNPTVLYKLTGMTMSAVRWHLGDPGSEISTFNVTTIQYTGLSVQGDMDVFGSLTMNGTSIKDLSDPIFPQDASTKAYIDAKFAQDRVCFTADNAAPDTVSLTSTAVELPFATITSNVGGVVVSGDTKSFTIPSMGCYLVSFSTTCTSAANTTSQIYFRLDGSTRSYGSVKTMINTSNHHLNSSGGYMLPAGAVIRFYMDNLSNSGVSPNNFGPNTCSILKVN